MFDGTWRVFSVNWGLCSVLCSRDGHRRRVSGEMWEERREREKEREKRSITWHWADYAHDITGYKGSEGVRK